MSLATASSPYTKERYSAVVHENSPTPTPAATAFTIDRHLVGALWGQTTLDRVIHLNRSQRERISKALSSSSDQLRIALLTQELIDLVAEELGKRKEKLQALSETHKLLASFLKQKAPDNAEQLIDLLLPPFLRELEREPSYSIPVVGRIASSLLKKAKVLQLFTTAIRLQASEEGIDQLNLCHGISLQQLAYRIAGIDALAMPTLEPIKIPAFGGVFTPFTLPESREPLVELQRVATASGQSEDHCYGRYLPQELEEQLNFVQQGYWPHEEFQEPEVLPTIHLMETLLKEKEESSYHLIALLSPTEEIGHAITIELDEEYAFTDPNLGRFSFQTGEALQLFFHLYVNIVYPSYQQVIASRYAAISGDRPSSDPADSEELLDPAQQTPLQKV